MAKSEGSITVILLIITLFLLLCAQLTAFYVYDNYEKQVDALNEKQIRRICCSLIECITKENLPEGTKKWFDVTLYPGCKKVTLYSKTKYSEAGWIRHVEVYPDTGSHNIHQLKFFAEKIGSTELNCGIISAENVIGTDFLPDGVLYKSDEKINLPSVYIFEPWSINELPMETVKTVGLCRRFYYIADYHGITFDNNVKVHGSAVISSEGNITLSSGCTFADRVILISEGKIILKNNVTLDNALLLSNRGIQIDDGCRINGAMISKGKIEFLGPVIFSFKKSVLNEFASIYYIT